LEIGHQKRLKLIKCLIFISNQAILGSGLGLGLQINLQIFGFYEGLLWRGHHAADQDYKSELWVVHAIYKGYIAWALIGQN
jgi:hypothetical protein